MMAEPKTPVSVLQELTAKLHLTPEFEYISKFEYRCVVLGIVVTAMAHSKKEAKQQAAIAMLEQLAARGHQVPPYGSAVGANPIGSSPGPVPLPQEPNFNEDDASDRARQPRPREATMPRRRTRGLKVADYHLAVVTQIDPERVAAAATLLAADRPGSPQSALAEVAAALGLTVESEGEPEDVGLALLSLMPIEPELLFAGDDADDAAAAALRYLTLAVAQPRPAHV